MITTVAEAFRHLELSGRVASPRALKRAYRKAVMKWHPDRFTDPTRKMDAEAATYGIMAAYDFLKSLPADDERVYARSSGWWRRAAPANEKPGTKAARPVRQQWLTELNPTNSTWRHTEKEERCGPLRAVFCSGLVAAVVMGLVLILWVQLNPSPKPSPFASVSPQAPRQVAAAPRVLPRLQLAPSLLEDHRSSTLKYQEARAKRRVFGESTASYERRKKAAVNGNGDDQQPQNRSTDYINRIRVLTGR